MLRGECDAMARTKARSRSPEGREKPESHTGDPPAHPLARPPVIRPDQGGCGDTVLALAPGRDRSLPAVLPPVREGRGWG